MVVLIYLRYRRIKVLVSFPQPSFKVFQETSCGTTYQAQQNSTHKTCRKMLDSPFNVETNTPHPTDVRTGTNEHLVNVIRWMGSTLATGCRVNVFRGVNMIKNLNIRGQQGRVPQYNKTKERVV